MGLLNVSHSQWAIAQEFFHLNKDEKKLKKSSKHHGFSYIKANGQLYAMANGTYLGEGCFAKVKIVENIRGENFVVKIEGKGLDQRTAKEILVLKRLGKHVGVMERELGEEKEFWKPSKKKSLKTNKKLYKILKMEEGKDLFNILYNHPDPLLTKTQRLIIGIRSCQVLMALHRQNVIHADIKPDNLRVIINGNNISVGIIDFGFSIIIPDEQEFVIDEIKGTRNYIAPEIYNPVLPKSSKGEFSFASDVYALGMMFKKDLSFEQPLYEDMMKETANERSSLSQIMSKLVNALAKQPDLDEAAQKLISELKPEKNVTRTKRPLPPTPTLLQEKPAIIIASVQPTVKRQTESFLTHLDALLTKERLQIPTKNENTPPMLTPMAHRQLTPQKNMSLQMAQLKTELNTRLQGRLRTNNPIL